MDSGTNYNVPLCVSSGLTYSIACRTLVLRTQYRRPQLQHTSNGRLREALSEGNGVVQYRTLTLIPSLTDADCESDSTQEGKNLQPCTYSLPCFVLCLCNSQHVTGCIKLRDLRSVLSSSGLCGVRCFETDVSRLPNAPTFKGEDVGHINP